MTGEERKLAIVRAVLPLFARQGFAETTTKDLAKAASVSEPLLYKHFPSKEALYLEIQKYCCSGIDPVVQKLMDFPPSTSSLVRLVYWLLRALTLGQPAGAIDWDTRHRVMLKSLLEDGSYARSMYQNRFEGFCSKIEACLAAAEATGDVVASPVRMGSRALFAHHVGAWMAVAHLPAQPAIDYKLSREQLLEEAIWFSLRGMGLTDRAMKAHCEPGKLREFFAD